MESEMAFETISVCLETGIDWVNKAAVELWKGKYGIIGDKKESIYEKHF